MHELHVSEPVGGERLRKARLVCKEFTLDRQRGVGIELTIAEDVPLLRRLRCGVQAKDEVICCVEHRMMLERSVRAELRIVPEVDGVK